jgi:uncharacterized protein DUF3574
VKEKAMRVSSAALLGGVFTVGLAMGTTLGVRGDTAPSARGTAATVHDTAASARDAGCGTASAAQLRTTLYFGLARPKGSVSELEWQVFLRDEVTARFPEGLTVWDAEGQWKGSEGTIGHERTKVLLLVHPDTPAAREGVQTVITYYRQKFEQESVLWETARVCVTS